MAWHTHVCLPYSNNDQGTLQLCSQDLKICVSSRCFSHIFIGLTISKVVKMTRPIRQLSITTSDAVVLDWSNCSVCYYHLIVAYTHSVVMKALQH